MQRRWNRISVLLVAPLLAVVVPAASHAQKPSSPCCSITRIDGATGIVTAKVNAAAPGYSPVDGRTFTFKVTDATVLQGLHVGQDVSADFTAKRVSVNGVAPCCNLIMYQPPDGGTQAKSNQPPDGVAAPSQPCCSEQEFRGVGQSPDGVRIQLVEVIRTSPDDIRVTWTIRNTTDKWQVLTKGNGGSSSDAYKLAWAGSLTDAAGRLLIKVAKDSQGHTLAAKHDPDLRAGGITLGPGKTLTTWAKFVAPEKVVTVSVDLPGSTMPWENVAVRKQAP